MTRGKNDKDQFGDHRLVYRHTVPVRITHWIVALCFFLLLMSGLQIFNAHPNLYWGKASSFGQPILALRAADNSTRQNPKGEAVLFGHAFDTTGVLGVSTQNGEPAVRGFPSWLTIPSFQDLAIGRRWHFFFAWILFITGAFYLIYGLVSRHAQRDLVPSENEMRHIGGSILDHLRLRFPRGAEARHYNVLQKLSYLSVGFIVFPILVLAGLAMSPGMDSLFSQLPWIFGGRQSARTIHFICAWLLVLFVIVHVVMVLISGVWNNLRSMITGRYDLGRKKT